MPHFDSHGYDGRPSYDEYPLFNGMSAADAPRVRERRSNLVQVNGVDIEPIEHDGKRYVTFAMIDRLHQRPAGTAARNFYTNRDYFVECDDFSSTNFVELQKMGVERPNPNGAILLTESGYLMLVKSLTDPLSWRVQRQLVNRYFRAEPLTKTTSAPSALIEALRDPLFAVEALLSANQAILNERRENATLHQQLNEAKPAIAFTETVIAADEDANLSDTGRLYGISSKEGIDRMLREGILYRNRDKKRTLKAYQPYRNRGFFRWVEDSYHHPRTGEPTSSFRTVITPAGRIWLFARWKATDGYTASQGSAE